MINSKQPSVQEKWAKNFSEKMRNEYLNTIILHFNKHTAGNNNLKLLSVEESQTNPEIALLLIYHNFLKETIVWSFNKQNNKISKYPHNSGNIINRKTNNDIT